jgi:sodium-coupled neutral amino acid transporter 11
MDLYYNYVRGGVGAGDVPLKTLKSETSGMELDETAHILDHQYVPDTPESSKSDLHQLIQDEDVEEKPRSTITMASFNFINSIIGSGIIGMPLALKEAGFGLGILLVILITVVTDYSLVLLIHAGEISNAQSYQDVMRAAFGRPGFIILTIMQFLYPMIAMISYNVIIGDTITKIVMRIGGPEVVHTVVGSRQFVICAVSLLVTLPLSLHKNVTRLSKVSLMSIIFIIFIIGVMIGEGFALPVPQTEDAWTFANTGVTKAIGIMSFAYMCHHNSFLIYDSIEEPTEKRWGIVTHISVLFAMICTLVLAITGYATFTGFSQGDILENYCHNDDVMNVARFLFAGTIMLTFPIECFVTREVIENAVFAFRQPPPLWRHALITVLIVSVSCAVSMLTDCLGIVLELNGVLNAAPLAYVFPPLCVMKLQNERYLSIKNIPRILTAVFGILVAIIGFVVVCIEISKGVDCSHGEEMAYCTESLPYTPIFTNKTMFPPQSSINGTEMPSI